MPDEIQLKVAVLEANFGHMAQRMDDVKEILERNNEELSSIREMIATGKGAWWAIGVVTAVVAGTEAVIHGAGAAIHKLLP